MTTKEKISCCKRLKKKFKEDWLCETEVKGGNCEGNLELMATLQFFHDSMALQDSMLQWYRALFIAFEGALFGLTYFISENNAPDWLVWSLVVIGIISCGVWWLVCTQRTNLAEKQRGEIEQLVSNS